MGYNDRYDNDYIVFRKKCPKCKKIFEVRQYEQTPGFRDQEDMVCPYCGHIVRTSMESEYICTKIETK